MSTHLGGYKPTTLRRQLSASQEVSLTRHGIGQHLNLELSTLKNLLETNVCC